jgi:hypothetical protein
MVTNLDGWVALQHHNSNPRTVKIDTVYYVFTPQHNISLAYIRPENVDRILAVQEKSCNCGGGRYKPAFFHASQVNANIWETGER